MGIGAALAAAIIWAVASTMLARQMRRVDTLSASFLRTFSALLFFAVAIFALDVERDFARMRATDLLQFLGTGVVTLAIGENLYAAAVSMIGLARAFTMVVGLYNLMAFVLAALLLGEEVTWRIVFGALLVVLGVYLVALYGRARTSPLARPTAASSAAGNAPYGWRRLPSLRGAGRRPPAIAAPPNPQNDEPPLAARPSLEVRLLLVGVLPSSFALGVGLALLTGLTWAASAVWLRSVSEGFDAAAVGAARLPAATTVLGVSLLAQRASTLRRGAVSRRQLALLGVSGVLGQGVASILFIFSLGEIGAGRTVVLFSTAPLFALPLGMLFLHERITWWVVGGTALAMAGVALLA